MDKIYNSSEKLNVDQETSGGQALAYESLKDVPFAGEKNREEESREATAEQNAEFFREALAKDELKREMTERKKVAELAEKKVFSEEDWKEIKGLSEEKQSEVFRKLDKDHVWTREDFLEQPGMYVPSEKVLETFPTRDDIQRAERKREELENISDEELGDTGTTTDERVLGKRERNVVEGFLERFRKKGEVDTEKKIVHVKEKTREELIEDANKITPRGKIYVDHFFNKQKSQEKDVEEFAGFIISNLEEGINFVDIEEINKNKKEVRMKEMRKFFCMVYKIESGYSVDVVDRDGKYDRTQYCVYERPDFCTYDEALLAMQEFEKNNLEVMDMRKFVDNVAKKAGVRKKLNGDYRDWDAQEIFDYVKEVYGVDISNMNFICPDGGILTTCYAESVDEDDALAYISYHNKNNKHTKSDKVIVSVMFDEIKIEK